MSLQRRRYDCLPPAAGPYAHAVRHGRLLYLSGLTAFGLPAQHADMAGQAAAILDRIAAVAAAEGRDLASLVRVTLFVTRLEELDGLRAVLNRYYGDAPPASSLVHVAGLFHADLAIEIEATLAID